MNNKKENLTQEEVDAIYYAANENEIKGEKIAEEIQPLLKDYFLGEFVCDNDAVVCTFLNGEKFRIVVQKVA